MPRVPRGGSWFTPLAAYAGGVAALTLLALEGLRAIRGLVAAGVDERLAATAARHLLTAAAAFALLGAVAAWLWARRRSLALDERALESELQALKTRFAHLVRHGNDIVMLLAEDGTVLEANDRACEAYGLAAERLRGLNVAALRAPDSGPSPAERLEEVRRRGGLVFETRQFRASGEVFPVEISTRCFEADGRTFFYSVGRDISERRRIQRRLRESEDRLRAILRDLPVSLVALDRAGVVTLGEGQRLPLAGVPPSEAVGQSIFVLLAHVPGAAELAQRALAGEVFVAKVRQDGQQLEYHFTPLRDARGELAGTVCVAIDVSERHGLQRALRESEERLRLALDGTQAAAVDWDFEAGQVHIGLYWAQLLGIPDGKLRGTVDELVARVVRPEEQDRVRADMRAHLAGKVETYDAEHQVVLSGGEVRCVHLRGRVATRGERGEPRRWVGIATDVTAQRQLEARLQIGERMASLGRLAGGVAHEINNPLSYVVSNLSYAMEHLREQVPGDDDVLAALEDARTGAQRARDIVRDLRIFSQPGEDRTEAVDVRNALSSALGLAHSELKHRGRLATRFDDVPPVMASERRLAQVFLNLIVNAAQSLDPKRSVQNEIRLTVARAADGRVAVEVADNGCGMPPQVRVRLFEPFFTTRPIGAGTGLGLSVCHGIVKALGGEIEVESEEGRGTTFRVLLPPAEGAVVAHPFPAPGPPALQQGARA